jgi:hypothetical protein
VFSLLGVAVGLALLSLSSVASADVVVFREIAHSSLGSATLDLIGTSETGSLLVGNLGSTGLDGVSVELPDACRYITRWQPLPEPTNGDLLRVRVRGREPGTEDELMGTLVFWENGSGLELGGELLPGEFLPNQMRVFDGFSIAYHGLIPDVGTIATVGTWPDEVYVESTCIDLVVHSVSFRWNLPTTVSIPDGPVLTADRIEVMSLTFATRFTHFAMELAGIPSILLLDAEFALPGTAVEDLASRVLSLETSVPNPFNPRTEIRYTLGRPGDVQLTVHDARGRLVRTLLRSKEEAGGHSVLWDGADDSGRPAGSGAYLIRLTAHGEIRNQKIALVR